MSNTNENPQPIIDLILADINAVIPNLSSLVASYRLLVGASEEIHRTPEVCPEVFERAVRRADNAGTLIDIFLELLCCKVAFSSDFLQISCAPVDLFRLLANKSTTTDIPFHTAEQVVEMEALRRVLDLCHHRKPCLPKCDVVCPKPPTAPPSKPTPPLPPNSDISEVEAVALVQLINSLDVRSDEIADPNSSSPETTSGSVDDAYSEIPANESRVRCKHLSKFRNKKTPPRKLP